MHPLPLHALHQAMGAQFGDDQGFEQVRTFGAPERAFAALTTRAALQDRTFRGLVRLHGPDAVTFLHGQTTNEVKKLEPGHGNGAVLLTARGKMLGEVRVLRRADDLLVETGVGFGEPVRDALERGCISEEVEFEDWTLTFGQLGLYGPEAHAVLTAALGAPAPSLVEHAHQEVLLGGAAVTVVGTRGPGAAGFDLLVPAPALEAVWRALRAAGEPRGLAPMGEDTHEHARIAAGLPRFGVDMTSETNPLEANLERDISYNKGCYVGQEVIAKATFRGHVNKKLCQLAFGATLPEVGAELSHGDRVVGRVTSAAALPDGRMLGLGYVKRDLAKPGVALAVAGGGTAEALGLAAPPSP